MCSGVERRKTLASIAGYPHVISRQPLSCLLVLLLEAEWEVTMHDLPQPLLAHLQREARDERDRARASRVETEKQIAAPPQQLDEVGRSYKA